MKNSSKKFQSTRGSALMVVMIVLIIMGLITASMLSFSSSERRANEYARLVVRTRNMAENTVNYATAQISAKLRRLRSTSPIKYSTAATGATKLHTPSGVAGILDTEHGVGDIDVHAGLFQSEPLTYIDPLDPSNATNPYTNLSIIKSRGKVVGRATLVNAQQNSTYTAYAQQEFSVAQIPLYQYLIFYNVDLEFGPGGDMILDGPVHTNGELIARNQYQKTNTLQFKERVTAAGGFYAHVTKLGAIYNNTGSAENNTGGTGPLLFQKTSGAVTDIRLGGGAPYTYRDYTMSSNASGTETEATRNAFRDWASGAYGGNFRTGVHGVEPIVLPGVQELADGVRKNAARTAIEPPLTTDTPALVDSKFSRHAGLYIIVNPTGPNEDRADGKRYGIKPDGTTVLMHPYSYRCWLNTIDSDGVPHPVEVVLPGQPSYGDPADPTQVIKNNLPNRFTVLTAIGSNQVIRIPDAIDTIPADPDNLANIGRPWTTYGINPSPATNPNSDAVLRQNFGRAGYTRTANPTIDAFTDAYFFDLRRSTNNNGYPANRSAFNFNPRPIAKIDFDMTRFRLAVERTYNGALTSTSIYNPDVPNPANWANNILNPNATRRAYPLGPRTGAAGSYVYNVFPLAPGGYIASDPFKIYRVPTGVGAPTPITAADLLDVGAVGTPWYDGIAIYIHSVDAENREMSSTDSTKRKRMDSAVRLWNGRGPIISMVATARTGCSIATNDALYIVGHYNADGRVNSTSSDASSYGGYSARYPDSSEERLCSIMADAITVLSQPVFTQNGSNYYQTDGWSDSLSPNTFTTSSWTSSWRTTNPSSSNQYDGIGSTRYVGHMPYDGNFVASNPAGAPRWESGDGARYITSTGGIANYLYTAPPARTTKFDGSDTEISSCLLVGIVATRSPIRPRETDYDGTVMTFQPSGYQNSGGVHNFPRMLENWTAGNAGLYIRGAMVAMFESEVACEPWLGTRIYSAPGRYWGLHQNLRAENAALGLHDVPLEPVLINVSRWHYAEFTPAQYAAEVALIEALPAN